MPLPLPPSLPARPNVSIRGGSVQPPSPQAASATPSASQPPAAPGLPAPPAGRKVMAYDDLAGGVEEGEVKSDDEEWEREVRERREGMRMREERRREREEEDRRRRSDRWAPERDRGRSYRDTRLSPRRSPRPSYWRPSRSRSRSPRRRRSFSLSRSRSPRGHSRSPRGRSRSRTRSLSPRSRRSYGSRSRSRTVSRSLSRSPSSRRSSRSRSRGRDRSRSRSRERSRSPARSTPLPSIPTGPKQMIPSGPKRQYSHHPGGPSQGPPKRIMASRPIGVPPPNAPTGPKEFQQGQTSQSQSQPQIQSPAGRSLAKGIVVKRTLSGSGGTGDKAEEGEVAAKGTNVETPIPTGPRSLIDKVSTPPGSGSSTRNPPTPLPPGAIPAGPRAMGLPPKIIPTVNSYRAPPKWLREREQARLETDRERDQASSPQPGSSSGVVPDEMRNPLAYTKSVTVTSTPPASLGLHLTGDEAADRELVKVAKEREVRERALLKPFKWIEWDQLFPPVTVSEEESTALTQIKHLRDAREGELRRKLDDSLRNLRGSMITMFNAGLEVKYAEERRANAEACLEKMGGSEALVI